MKLFDLLAGPFRHVHVALQSPYTSYMVAADAQALKDTGCNFETTDPSRIESLLALLDHVEIIDGTARSHDPREAILLTSGDGTTFTLEFDRKWKNSDVGYGKLRHLDKGVACLVARNNLPDDLFYWAAALGKPTAGPGSVWKQAKYETWFDEQHRQTPWQG